MATSTLSGAMLDIFVAPKSLFDGLRSARGWNWAALILILAISSACIVSFYSGMSPEWVVEQQMLQVGDVSPSEEEQIRAYLTQSAGTVGWLGAIFNGLFILISLAILAGYFKLVSGSDEYGYGDWFGFAIWTQMPTVVYMLGFLVLYLTAGTPDLPLMLINYASLNQLLLGLSVQDALYTWAESLNLFYIWYIALAAIGLNRWTSMSITKATILSALPFVLVFGIWGVLAA
jgi:hypothetical protein